MKYRLDTQPDQTRIQLSGTLSFQDHLDFRRMVDEVMATKPRKVTVDLDELSTIDSAGLGLLVILNGKMKETGGSVTLSRPNEAISRLLTVVQFEKLCTIER